MNAPAMGPGPVAPELLPALVVPARGLLTDDELADSRRLGAVKVSLESAAAKVEKILELFVDRPHIMETDPRVAALAFRFASHTERGRTYDLSFAPESTAVRCECWPSLKGERCRHVDAVLGLHRSESKLAELLLELRSVVALARVAAGVTPPEAINKKCSGCGVLMEGPEDAPKTSHGMCSLACWNEAAARREKSA